MVYFERTQLNLAESKWLTAILVSIINLTSDSVFVPSGKKKSASCLLSADTFQYVGVGKILLVGKENGINYSDFFMYTYNTGKVKYSLL